jgi:hypothetical protein
VGLFTSSVIPENRKHDVSETGSFSVLRWGRKTPTQFDPLERTNFNHWPSHLALHLMTETDPVSETSCFLFSRIQDVGKSPKAQ